MKPNFLLTTTAIKIWLVQRGGILAQLCQFGIPLSFAPITKMNFMIWQMFLLVSKCYFYRSCNFRKTWGAISKWKERSRAYEQAKETSSVWFELALGRSKSLSASKLPSTYLTCQLLRFKNFHLLWQWLWMPKVISRDHFVVESNQRRILRSFVTRMQCHYFLRVWNCLCVC